MEHDTVLYMLNHREYKVEYEFSKDGDEVIATIPELNYLSSFGNSFAEAEANIREAALGYFEVLVMK